MITPPRPTVTSARVAGSHETISLMEIVGAHERVRALHAGDGERRFALQLAPITAARTISSPRPTRPREIRIALEARHRADAASREGLRIWQSRAAMIAKGMIAMAPTIPRRSDRRAHRARVLRRLVATIHGFGRAPPFAPPRPFAEAYDREARPTRRASVRALRDESFTARGMTDAVVSPQRACSGSVSCYESASDGRDTWEGC